MGNFVYQTHHILERHLKIGTKMSLKEIIDHSQDGMGLDVLRGPALKIYSEETNGGINLITYLSTHVPFNSVETTTFVNYDGVVAKIVRADIECTNGYIHLIDKVVVKVTIQF